MCYEGDIESDIGISLCKSEATGKEVLVANIESGTIDAFGYLKQDYLIVDSIGLTYDIYKEAGIEPFTVNQLLEKSHMMMQHGRFMQMVIHNASISVNSQSQLKK